MSDKKEQEKIIRLTMTEDDARYVANACEFFARVKNGQFKEIIWNFLDIRMDADDFCKRQEQMEDLLYKARAILYPQLGEHIGSSWGYGKFRDADKAFDVYQLLRAALGNGSYPYFTSSPCPDAERKVGDQWEKIVYDPFGGKGNR